MLASRFRFGQHQSLKTSPVHTQNRISSATLVCILLVAATILAFWNISAAGFVNYDDPAYVSANPIVQRGLTAENIRWAFTTFHYNNWHPLTWLSYMVDCQLFGMNPLSFHLVNLAFHTANALFVFLLLWRLTGSLWPSAIVAAFFAWHPLHVESVAWISERKDVLSTFFALLTICAYAKYVKRPRAGWYLLTLVLFLLALMSKAMAVTVPFLLLLMDIWPLRRLNLVSPGWFRILRQLILEKLPLFALSLAVSFATFFAQGEAVMTTSHLALTHRLENAVVSYARYLGKSFWPADLAVFYPHPIEGWSLPLIAASAALLLCISALAVLTVRNRPYLFTGWFWFLGTLIPVIGLVQVGSQSIADRYMYLPSIGLFIAIVWGVRDLVKAFRLPPLPLALGTGAALLACGLLTFRQVRVWKDSFSLFSHAERVTPPNIVTLNNLTAELLAHGQVAEADARVDTAIRLFPREYLTWWHAGNRARRRGDFGEAATHYQTALQLQPREPQLHFLLALVLEQQNESGAIHSYREAIRLNPQFTPALNNLAWLLATHPDTSVRNGAEAVALAERACQLTQSQQAYFIGTLAAAYAEVGQFELAAATAEKAIAVAEARADKAHAQRTRAALALYRNRQPWHPSAP
jgi:Flp pilus assembly protein TadD